MIRDMANNLIAINKFRLTTCGVRLLIDLDTFRNYTRFIDIFRGQFKSCPNRLKDIFSYGAYF